MALERPNEDVQSLPWHQATSAQGCLCTIDAVCLRAWWRWVWLHPTDVQIPRPTWSSPLRWVSASPPQCYLHRKAPSWCTRRLNLSVQAAERSAIRTWKQRHNNSEVPRQASASRWYQVWLASIRCCRRLQPRPGVPLRWGIGPLLHSALRGTYSVKLQESIHAPDELFNQQNEWKLCTPKCRGHPSRQWRH